MKPYITQLKVLAYRIGLLFLLYSLSRILFYFLNPAYFKDSDFQEVLISLFSGLRFDFTVIAWSNGLFILLSVLPFNVYFKRWYQFILNTLFILVNTIFLLFNCIDLAYFRFTNRRAGSDIFNQIFAGQTDVMSQIPDYFRDFWPVILFFVFIVGVLFFCRARTKIKSNDTAYTYDSKNILFFSVSVLLCCGGLISGIRGGWQYIPLQVVDAGKNVSPKYIPLVLNTPFTIVRSMESSELEYLQLAELDSAIKFIQPVKHNPEKKFLTKNIVVIILEGFSKEYTGLGKRKSITPFLDSLMQQSMVFTNAWSNGKQSIEGVPAVLSGIPSFMSKPYINSSYAGNQINSFPQLLKKVGYTSAFFHGGKNGTMNFDSYAKSAGYDYYFGMNEYNNDVDFDGNWGIWDEPYLQYCVKEFSKMKTPFFTSVFTLSSHHPFKIPENHKNRFQKINLQCSESVSYTDHSLREFFNSAKKEKWFANTLFVIVPDHTGISADPFYANPVGQHAIPMMFYSQDGMFRGECKKLTQQIDILPTVLDTLGYHLPFFSFGKSAFAPTSKDYSMFFENGNYFLLNDSMSFTFLNHELKQVFNFSTDSTLSKNILGKYKKKEDEAIRFYKNFLQLYHHALIKNLAFREES